MGHISQTLHVLFTLQQNMFICGSVFILCIVLQSYNAKIQSLLFLCRRSNSLALLVENWKVYGGVVSLDNLRQPYLVKTILLNENYNSQTNDQDIALLRLRSPVVFDGQSHLHLIKIMLLFTLLSHPRLLSEFGPYIDT